MPWFFLVTSGLVFGFLLGVTSGVIFGFTCVFVFAFFGVHRLLGFRLFCMVSLRLWGIWAAASGHLGFGCSGPTGQVATRVLLEKVPVTETSFLASRSPIVQPP